MREPRPADTTPKCPTYLDKRAKEEWRRLLPILKRMRVVTEADHLSLANLCNVVSMLVHAQEKLNEIGMLSKAPSGYIIQRKDKPRALLRSFANEQMDRSGCAREGSYDRSRQLTVYLFAK